MTIGIVDIFYFQLTAQCSFNTNIPCGNPLLLLHWVIDAAPAASSALPSPNNTALRAQPPEKTPLNARVHVCRRV
jgi:hypothetical protein